MKRGDVTGRVVMVIGGASGIGSATVRAAVRAGARVVAADLAGPTIPPLSGPDYPVRYVDVTDEGCLRRLRDSVLEQYGRIDVVVNCAGVVEPGPLHTMPLGAIRRQFDVNAMGTVLVTKTILPTFLERGSGHFVHLSSLGGIVPMPNEAVYSATKFAVRGFCLAAAQELRGTGVRVTVVCPDSTDTGQLLTEAANDGAPLSFASHPLHPDAVARAILGVIRRPRREVCVPARRGVAAKLAGASTLLFAAAYPVLDALGTRSRIRFLKQRMTRMACRSAHAGSEV